MNSLIIELLEKLLSDQKGVQVWISETESLSRNISREQSE